jgi:hypothetical protein
MVERTDQAKALLAYYIRQSDHPVSYEILFSSPSPASSPLTAK